MVPRLKKGIPISLTAVLLSACTTLEPQFDLNYEAPVQMPISNEYYVSDNFDNTWAELVAGLSETFFVINNIDKESNLLNLSFSTSNNIGDYVDCGVSKATFSLADIQEDVTYEVADKSERYGPSSGHRAPPNTTYIRLYRSPTLQGRANVYVAPEGEKTLVRVNARYAWTFRATAEEYMYMPLYNTYTNYGSETTTSDPISFNTNTLGANDEVICVSTGAFENEILDIVR